MGLSAVLPITMPSARHSYRRLALALMALGFAASCDDVETPSGTGATANASAAERDGDRVLDATPEEEADPLPRETASDGPLKASAVATDLTVEVELRWKYQGEGNKNNLVAAVHVTGEAAKRTVAFGMLELQTATVDGKPLSPYDGMRAGKDPRKSIEYRDLDYPGTDPEGFEIPVEFNHPATGVKMLTKLEATCLMRVFEVSKALEFSGVKGRSGEPLEHAALKEAGVHVTAKWDAQNAKLVITQQDGVLGQVGEVRLVDAGGKPLPGSGSTDLSGELPVFDLQLDDVTGFDNAKLQLTLYAGLKVLRAEVSSANITIPTED